MARMRSTTAPAIAEVHGRCWITRLQRYAAVSRSGFGSRRGTSRLSEPTKNPAMSTITASGRPMMSGVMFSPTPTSAIATRPAAIRPRHRVSSTRSPAKPSNAGSNVSDAATVTATTDAAPTARPVTNVTPMTSMPSSEITTVNPANRTDRPAVSMAIVTDSRTVWPAWSCSR